MDVKLKKGYVNSVLGVGVACVVFMKKNGDARCMLATRDTSITTRFSRPLNGELAGMDKRNDKHEGVISVVDLEINDVRSFRLDRLIFFQDMGSIDTHQDYERVMKDFADFKTTYEKANKDKILTEDEFSAELDGAIRDEQMIKKLAEETLQRKNESVFNESLKTDESKQEIIDKIGNIDLLI